ncbi:MAG: hypothetical protein Q3983_05620 [Capnocytophaga sp.]|nr:hypothetical protein [Capnocytophaga sp.]
MKKARLLILLSFFCLQCDKFYDLQIYNNTDRTINIYIADIDTYYPDTLLPLGSNRLREIKINETLYETSMVQWNNILKNLPKDTLSIFIFNTDTLNKYSWEEIRRNYKILKRYDLSIQDLENLDYKVYYPPTPEMSHMKMYPKYGR